MAKVRNDRVIVYDETIPAGQTRRLAEAHPAVVVYLTGGSLETDAGRVTVERGQTVFEPGGPRSMTNTGAEEVHFVRIELLGKGLAATWGARGLSPNYKVLFENPHVRVYDIRIKAGGVEPQHTHHDRVIVCLSGAQIVHRMPDGSEEPATLTAGDINWRRGETHVGQNVGKTDLWVLAVEPK